MLTTEELEKIGIYTDNRNVVDHSRMNWTNYFLKVAQLIALRSHDSQTQHGCVLVRNNRIISTGFNGFPSGSNDTQIPNIRPFKYQFVNHDSENALMNAARLGISVEGSELFGTGLPCHNCSRQLVSVGILNWTIGNKGHQNTETEEILRRYWIENFGVKINMYEQ